MRKTGPLANHLELALTVKVLYAGPHPGLPSPGLIEATTPFLLIPLVMALIRGSQAPASLKLEPEMLWMLQGKTHPGLPSPGLIEASPLFSSSLVPTPSSGAPKPRPH